MCRVASIACLLLVLCVALADSMHHCHYAILYMRKEQLQVPELARDPNGTSVSGGSAKLCERGSGFFSQGQCCDRLLEGHFWSLTVTDFNDAYRSFVQHKLAHVQQYRRYLLEEHLRELEGKIQLIPNLLSETGGYETSELWPLLATDSLDEVESMFKQLGRNNLTTHNVTLTLMEFTEAIIKLLIDKHILQRISEPRLLELMQTVLLEWISDDDKIVFDNLFDADSLGSRFIQGLARFNQTLVSLRMIERFWLKAANNEFVDTGLEHTDFTDTMSMCIRSLVQVSRCQFCSVATKDVPFCPASVENQTSCIAAFLQPHEQVYSALMNYFRALQLDYAKQYGDAIHQFGERHLAKTRLVVKNRWFDILEAAVQQFSRRKQFLSEQQRAMAVDYLEQMRDSELELLFEGEDLVGPVPILLDQLVANPLIRMTAEFADAPGQFSIVTPLHQLLVNVLLASTSSSAVVNDTFVNSRCWNGGGFGLNYKRPEINGTTLDSNWQSTLNVLNDTAACVLCLALGSKECNTCVTEDSAAFTTLLAAETTTVGYTTHSSTSSSTSTSSTSRIRTSVSISTSTDTSTSTTSSSLITSLSENEDYEYYQGKLNERNESNETIATMDDIKESLTDTLGSDDEDEVLDNSGTDGEDIVDDQSEPQTTVVFIGDTDESTSSNEVMTESSSRSSSGSSSSGSGSISSEKSKTNDQIRARSQESQAVLSSGTVATRTLPSFTMLLVYTVTSIYVYAMRLR